MKKPMLPLALAVLALASTQTVSARGVFGLGNKVAQFDADGDGVLSEEERAAAKAAREEARQAVIDEFDVDGDGVLNEEERAAAKEARDAERAAAKEARFAEIDGVDGDGEVTAEELQAALPDASEERVAATLARYDVDENGTISLEEFTNPTRPDRRKGGKKARGHRGQKKEGRRGRAIGIRGGRHGGADADGGAAEGDAPDPVQ